MPLFHIQRDNPGIGKVLKNNLLRKYKTQKQYQQRCAKKESTFDRSAAF